jgi:hypothetical protein
MTSPTNSTAVMARRHVTDAGAPLLTGGGAWLSQG